MAQRRGAEGTQLLLARVAPPHGSVQRGGGGGGSGTSAAAWSTRVITGSCSQRLRVATTRRLVSSTPTGTAPATGAPSSSSAWSCPTGFDFLPGVVHSSATKQDQNHQQEEQQQEKKKPLVVTLGWLGANKRHLGKYSSWYSSRGFDTLSFISPASAILLPQLGRKNAIRLLDYALDLSHQTRDGKQEKRPILFHVFSNNGLYFYANLLQQIAQHPQYERVLHSTVGCVFDSTPSHLSVDIFTKGFGGAIVGAMGITNKGRPVYDHWLVSPIVRTLFSILLAPPFFRNTVSGLLDSFVRFQPKCPQLYLYSKGDDLIPYTDIELAMNAVRELSIPVVGKCWEDSPHVGHFRMHPAEYASEVDRFLSGCTQRWHQNGDHTDIVQHRPDPLTPDDLNKIADKWKRLIVQF